MSILLKGCNKSLLLIAFFGYFFISLNASANLVQANAWLESQITDSLISTPNDIGNSQQATFEAITALQLIGTVADASIEPAKQAMLQSSLSDTETIARQLLLRVANTNDTQTQQTALLSRFNLLKSVSANANGLGTFDYYDNTVLETAWALRALGASRNNSADALLLLSDLLANQLADGSFAQQSTELFETKLYQTYLAVTALQAYRTSSSQVDTAVSRALDYLQSNKNTDGHWGDAFSNSLAILTAIANIDTLENYQTAIDQLLADQAANGAWLDDVYITALAARTLYLVDNFTAQAPIVFGGISGQIIDANTQQSLSGVMITAQQAGQTTQQSSSNQTGDFQITDLPAGEYQLQFSLSGFATQTRRINVEANQTIGLGQIAMVEADAVISGQVQNQQDGTPIVNALVTIGGTSNVVVNTNQLGEFYALVRPGAFTVAISANGFDTVNAADTVSAGETVIFSPQLYASNTTPNNALSDLFGVVVDQAGNPIPEAQVTVLEPSTGQTVNVQSNASGEFTIADLNSGAVSIRISKTGFLSQEYAFILAQATDLNAGNLSLISANATLEGQITDSETGLSITAATIRIIETGETASSDTQGQYSFSATPGDVTLEISANDYQTITVNSTLLAGVIANFSPQLVPVGSTPDQTLSRLQGLVVDNSNGAPLINAQLTVLGQALSVLTNNQGEFVIEGVTPGTAQLRVSKTGYANADFDVIIPDALTINVGTIRLQTQQSSDTAIVQGRIIDANSGQALSDVTLSLETVGQQQSDAQGEFTFSAISAGTYELTITKAGYLISRYQLEVPKGISLALGDIVLTPIQNLTESSILGQVLDRASGDAIAGATVTIAAFNLSTTSDAQGQYRIDTIPATEFDVAVSATGYFANVGRVSLPQHGTSTVDLDLQASTSSGIVAINAIFPNQSSYPAYSEVELMVHMENFTPKAVNVALQIGIIDSQGNVIEDRPEVIIPAGASLADGYRLIPANDTLQHPVAWFPLGTPPGDYQAVIQAYDSAGRLLAENTTIVTLEQSQLIGGIAQFDPPLTQLSAQRPVAVTANIANRGNVDLAAGTVTATVTLKNQGVSQNDQIGELFFYSEITSFNKTTNIELDSQGNRYILDAGQQVIVKISPSGQQQTIIDGLNRIPVDFDISATDEIYVLNSQNNSIDIFSTSLEKTTLTLGTSAISNEQTIEVLDNGDIFIANNTQIFQVNRQDSSLRLVADVNLTNAGFRDIAISATGDLFLTDFISDNVFKYSQGRFSHFADLDAAHGIDIDAQGNLYVTSYLTDGKLSRISPQGEITELASGLNLPFDVFVEDNQQSVVVSNSGSHEVVRIYLNGQTELVTRADFNKPDAVAYTPQSELLVYNDSFKDIRQLTNTGPATVISSNVTSRLDALTVDASGKVYFANNNRVIEVLADGSQVERYSITGAFITGLKTQGSDLIVLDNLGRIWQSAAGSLLLFAESVLNGNRFLSATDDGRTYSVRPYVSTTSPAAVIQHLDTGAYNSYPVSADRIEVSGFTFDQNDQFYVSDSVGRQIIKLDNLGNTEVLLSTVFQPTALALDELNNHLYIVERNTDRLHRFDLATQQIEVFAQTGSTFNNTSKLVMADNALWSINSSRQLIRVNLSDASATVIAGSNYSNIDTQNGGVFATVFNANTVVQLDNNGDVVQTILDNSAVRIANGLAVQANNRVATTSGSAANSQYLTFDTQTDSVLATYVSSSALTSITALDNQSVLAVSSLGILSIAENSMAERTTSNTQGLRLIDKVPSANAAIVSSSNRVYRFNLADKQLAEIANGVSFSQIDSLSVAANGEIALAEGRFNQVTRLDNQGNLVSSDLALINLKGVATDANGDIVVASQTPSDVYKLTSNNQFEPLNAQRFSNTTFINKLADGTLQIVASTGTSRLVDGSGQVSLKIHGGFSSTQGNVLFITENTGFAVNSTGLMSFDLSNGTQTPLSSGFSKIVDMESDQNRLLVLDENKQSLQQLDEQGRITVIHDKLLNPSGVFINQQGDKFIAFEGSKIALYRNDEATATFFDVQDIIPTDFQATISITSIVAQDNLVTFSTAENRVYTALAKTNSTSSVPVNEVVYTQTQAIEALAIGSDTVALDFGSWVPEVDGDFEVSITHTDTSNSVNNTLHVGSNAQGQLSLANSTAFPGDKLIDGALSINGADFTQISQINAEAINLNVSSGAVGGRSIASDSLGNVYVSDLNKILKITPDGTISDFVDGVRIGVNDSGTSAASFIGGQGISVDQQDYLYAGSGNDILRISPQGQVEILNSFPNKVEGVAVDYENNLLMVDLTGIYRVNLDGTRSLVASIDGMRAITVDRNGIIYVAGRGTNVSAVIYKILPDGSVTNYLRDLRLEYEGVNIAADCADNILFAPIGLPNFKELGSEEDGIYQISGATGQVSQTLFGPMIDRALGDIDVLFYDRVGQRLLIYTDFSNGKIFSFPIICGGIDVDVTLVTRGDVDLSAAQPAPTNVVALPDGTQQYQWQLQQVQNQGAQIQLKYLFKDLLVGEVRAALQDAYLEFENTFVPGETIKVPLSIPQLSVEQPVALNLALDKIEYRAFEEVQLTQTVRNDSDATFSGRIETSIVDEQNNVVHLFAPSEISDLGATSEQNFFAQWNTEQTLLGNYTVKSVLFDANSRLITQTEQSFSIVSDDSLGNSQGATLRTTTDRAVYHTTDTVELSDLVRNISSNTIIRGARLQLSVLDVNQQQVFETERELSDLTPQYSQVLIDSYAFTDLPEGNYQVQAQIVSNTGSVLVADQTTFEVTQDIRQTLTGQVRVSAPQVEAGQVMVCTDTLNNQGNDLTVSVRRLVLNADTAALVSTDESTVDLQNSVAQIETRSVDTTGFSAGAYACALQANINGAWQTLDTAFFTVTELVLPTLQVDLNTDRPVYHISDTVELSNLVRNLSDNIVAQAITLRINVFDANNQPVFSTQRDLGDLAAQFSNSYTDDYVYQNQAEGSYRVLVEAVNATNLVLASDETTFEIRADLNQTLSGSVDISAAQVQRGQAVTCTDTLSNQTLDLTVQIRQLVLNSDTDTVITTQESSIDLLADTAQLRTRTVETASYANGNYACVLQANIDNVWQTLDTAFFSVSADIDLGTSTDRPVYHTSDTVEISNLVRNLSDVNTVEAVTLSVEVFNESDQSVFTAQQPLGGLNAQFEDTLLENYSYQDQTEGIYRIVANVVDANAVVLASDEATFEVRADLNQTLTGSVSVSAPAVQLGQSLSCTDTVTNQGKEVSIALRQRVLQVDTDTVLVTQPLNLDLQADIAQATTRTIDTAAYALGNYACDLQANIDGVWQTLDTAPFVVSQDLTLGTSTDRALYHTSDTVEISNLVRNLSDANTVEAVSLRIDIVDENDQSVFTTQRDLGDLAAQFEDTFIDNYRYENQAQGNYRIVAELLDANNVILGNDEASFDIRADLSQTLSGTVSVSAPQVEAGQALVCTDTLSNQGRDVAVLIRQLVTHSDTNTVIATQESNLDLIADTEQSLSRTLDTTGYTPGNYACALQANIDNVWQTLDTALFAVIEVSPPELDIALQINQGNQGRVLILLDDEHTNNGNGIEPALIDQRIFLESLLTQAGWSYTIVTQGSAFVDELRTGQYSNYMLLSEAEKISEQGQKELREAVFGGAGLIEAGSHDQRQGRIDDALGVKFKGKSNHIQGISLFDSVLHHADNLSLSIAESVLTAELEGANKVAEYIPDAAKGNQAAPPAMTVYDYGLGQSVYVGFDVLAEASLLNMTDSVFAQLLLNSLNHVNDENLAAVPGLAYPVTFTVSNQGSATGARLRLDLPNNVQLVDALGSSSVGQPTVVGQQLVWEFDLADNAVLPLTLWLSLPAETITLNATVESGEEPNWTEQSSASLSITPSALVSVDNLLSSVPNSHKWKQIRQAIERAQGYLAQQNWGSALRELLKAADKLAVSNLAGSEQVRQQLAQLIRQTEQQL